MRSVQEALLLCFSLTLPFTGHSILGGQEPPGPQGDGRIEVRPRVVYSGGTVTLSLSRGAPDGEAPFERVTWQASGGTLLSDDIAEVSWLAPAKPGRCRIQARGVRSGVQFQAALDVDVRSPSTDGMVWIPAGTFVRGDIRGTNNTTELKTIQNACDEPFDRVHLDGYWIDRRPVTNRQYATFLDECLAQGLVRPGGIAAMGELDGSWVPYYYFLSYERLVPHYYEARNARKPEFLHYISYDGSRFRVKPGKEEQPVVDVSWFGSSAYARFHGKQLPSEAQWEKSARGSADGRRYCWGDALPTPYHANVDYYVREPSAVGKYSPLSDSPYGVSDLLSSCFEWTQDWFNPTYYEDYKTETPARNPTGPFWGRAHAIRGLPYGLQFPLTSFDGSEPVSNRYSWFFEFQLGDAFANRSTTFRMVVQPPDETGPARAAQSSVASHD